MRLASSLAVLTASAIAVPVASADDTPTAIIDRSLSLEPQTLQPNAAVFLTHSSAVMDPDPATFDFLEIGADYGILRHLQAGAVVDIQLSPSSEFSRALVSGQYQLLTFAAARLDLGAEHAAGKTNFVFGLGLPLRLKLTDALALISSRPYAYGAEDDLFTFRAGDDSFGSNSEYRIPVGILYQLDSRVALSARSGFRRAESASFVPFGIDGVISVSRLDFGLSFDLLGQVSPSDGPGFFDVLRLRGFAQVRI
jgi:hypothetical protein